MANSKIQRLLGTLLLLRSKEWVSSLDLATRFDVSLRTVYRDIETLQKHGIPVQGVPGPEGGYRLHTETPSDPLVVSSDDALNLYLLGLSGSGFADSAGQNATSVIEKLENVVRPEDAKLLRRITSRIHFDTTDWYWKDESSGWIPLLREAVFDQRKLLVVYKPRGKNKIESIHVAPYGLVWKGGEWYLVGKTDERNSVARFRASRIAKASLQSDSFQYPDGFDLPKWWNEDLAAFGKGEIRVRLLVGKDARDEFMRLATKDTSEIIYQGDDCIMTLYVDKWTWLIPLVLSYTGNVYVEEPLDFRQAIVNSLATGLQGYAGQAKSTGHTFENDDSRLRTTRGARS